MFHLDNCLPLLQLGKSFSVAYPSPVSVSFNYGRVLSPGTIITNDSYYASLSTPSSISIRSGFDFLKTGKRNLVGDRACTNQQLVGSVSFPVSIRGIGMIHVNGSDVPFEVHLDSLTSDQALFRVADAEVMGSEYLFPSYSIGFSDMKSKRYRAFGTMFRGTLYSTNAYSYPQGNYVIPSDRFALPLDSICTGAFTQSYEYLLSSTTHQLRSTRCAFYFYKTLNNGHAVFVYVAAHQKAHSQLVSMDEVAQLQFSDINASCYFSVHVEVSSSLTSVVTQTWTAAEDYIQSAVSGASLVDFIDHVRNDVDPFGIATFVRSNKVTFGVLIHCGISVSDRLTGLTPEISSAIAKSLRSLKPGDFSSRQYEYETLVKSHATSFPELALTAVDNCSFFTSNSVAYLRDIPLLGAELKALAALSTGYDNPANWADAWLTFRFGTRLSYSDTVELINGFRSALKQFNRDDPKNFWFSSNAYQTNEVIISAQRSMLIKRGFKFWYVDPHYKDIQSLGRRLLEFDIVPNLSNCWDLIPYTFVVDWFVDVGGLLEQVDLLAQSYQYDVFATCETTAGEIPLHITDYETLKGIIASTLVKTGACANLNDAHVFLSSAEWTGCAIKYFKRTTGHSLPRECPHLQLGHFSDKNIIDSVSLLVQRC